MKCEKCGQNWSGLHSCPTTENEYEYLSLLEKIICEGTVKKNRTGVDTIGILGTQSRYDLNKGFPLLTTKKVWLKGVAIELLWFLQGTTNIKFLVDNNVNIWTDDAYRFYKEEMGKWKPDKPLCSKEEFVKTIKQGNWRDGFPVGELGPCYGSQWRKWPYYKDPDPDCMGCHRSGFVTFDQIANLVDGLKNNPDSRRHILSAWNAPMIDQMALPPCHVMSQWSVVDGVLHSHMYQRSCDMFLGVPFNIASYALLTHMLAQVCGYKVGEFIHTMHDVHIYTNHIEQVKEQLSREPRPAPKLVLNKAVDNIDDFVYNDIKVEGYDPHPKIKAELVTDDITKQKA